MRTDRRLLSSNSDDGLTLANVKHYINFLILRIDHIILDSPSVMLNHITSRGELSGFKLAYKIPKAPRGNAQLDKEILANGDYSSLRNGEINQILFKHKKVFPIELDPELIEKWEASSLQISLNAVTASHSRAADRKSSKHIARTFVPLSDLLVPPFQISRDCIFSGSSFNGRLALSIELGSRNVRISELLGDLRRNIQDDTFSITEAEPARRTRSRSISRCRSHSRETENCDLVERPYYVSKPSLHSRPSTSHSITDLSNSEKIYRPIRTDNPFEHHEARRSNLSDECNISLSPDLVSDINTGKGGALQLEITAHEAADLPLVRNQMGHLVPPMAFIQMLGREEQIMSTIAPASCNPTSERGNLLIKVLHKIGDQVAPLGCVTLISPLNSFINRKFEISLFTETATTTATIRLSLKVFPNAYTICSNDDTRKKQAIDSRNSSESRYSKNELENAWPTTEENQYYRPTYRQHTTTPPVRHHRVSTEALRSKLQDDVEDLLNVMNNLGRH